LKCSYSQARRHILQLQKERTVKAISQDGHVWIYSMNNHHSKCKIAKVQNAIKKIEKKDLLITKKNIHDNSDLSLSSIKLAIKHLLEVGYLALDDIDNHEKIYIRTSSIQ
jgi:ribosomal protein S25